MGGEGRKKWKGGMADGEDKADMSFLLIQRAMNFSTRGIFSEWTLQTKYSIAGPEYRKHTVERRDADADHGSLKKSSTRVPTPREYAETFFGVPSPHLGQNSLHLLLGKLKKCVRTVVGRN